MLVMYVVPNSHKVDICRNIWKHMEKSRSCVMYVNLVLHEFTTENTWVYTHWGKEIFSTRYKEQLFWQAHTTHLLI